MTDPTNNALSYKNRTATLTDPATRRTLVAEKTTDGRYIFTSETNYSAPAATRAEIIAMMDMCDNPPPKEGATVLVGVYEYTVLLPDPDSNGRIVVTDINGNYHTHTLEGYAL